MTHHILVAEDQEDIRQLIMMTLEFGDYTLHEADNGPDAWRQVQNIRPRLVLLDIMMPGGLDGYQICEKIKQDDLLSKTKVILLTARGQQSDRAYGLKMGCDAYLVKPFSPLELIDTVENLLND
jgi:DNA-binding response OmpR family regulator